MAELPESLKRYLPAPLAILLAIAWWFFADPIKELVQKEVSHTPARIEIESKANQLYVVRIEVTPYSDKAFEGVRVDIQLQSKADDITGELFRLNGTHSPLTVQMENTAGNAFLIETISGTAESIRLQQRENIEIDLHASGRDAVKKVWLYSNDRQPISSLDLNQHWPLANIAWRCGQVLLGFAVLGLLYKPAIRLFSHKALKQLEADIEFLHSCWETDAAALARFDREFQPLIDGGTAKYLKVFDPAVRDSVRKPVIARVIFRRARSLPKLRRSLASEVERFVIHFCLKMFEHELEELKKKAKADEARIR
jgi:hypothetical protein